MAGARHCCPASAATPSTSVRALLLLATLAGLLCAGASVAAAEMPASLDQRASARAPGAAIPGLAAPDAPARPAAPDDAYAQPRIESVGVGVLPRGVVSALAQDRAGFLWLGTGDGLVRYDGHHFRPQARTGPDGVAHNLGFVRTLLAARDGRLWIATESDGLAVYDPGTEAVQLVALAGAAAPVPAAAPTVLALAEEADGGLWVGTMGDGLVHLRPDGTQRQRHQHDRAPGSLPDDRVLALLVDHQGSVWVGTWQGLVRRVRGGDRFEPVDLGRGGPGGVPPRVSALAEASDGRIWVGTQTGDLAVVDPLSARAVHLPPAAPGRGPVHAMLEAPSGQMWVAHGKGVELRGVAAGRLRRALRHDPHHAGGLAADEVRSLLLDQAGWVWLGGHGLGLQRHNPGNLAIRVRGPDHRPGARFEQAAVRSVLQARSGMLWVGTHTDGVVLMDAALQVTGGLHPPPLPPEPGVLPVPAAVDALALARDGSIWLAVDGTTHRYTGDGRLQRSVHHGAGHSHRLLVDRDDVLWMATQDGLYRLGPGSAALQRLPLRGGQPLRGDVYALVLHAGRELWVGGEHGLYRLPHGAAELQPVATQPGAGLGKSTVIGLLVDRRQTLWVDTAMAGLHRMTHWDGQHAGFDRVSERHGVAGRPYGVNLLDDARGRIWTQQFVYDPAADRLTTLTSADGVDVGTGWFRAYERLADGRLVFGGTRGLLVVEPERFDPSDYAPPVVVSELRVDGRREPLQRARGGLVLAPDERQFSVEFAALDFSDPARCRYAYQLQGVDAGWIETGAEFRVASYGNLAPGDYVLRVRATNRAGAWSARELEMPVQVQHAWWQTWWYRGSALLALAGAILVLLQLRTRMLRQRGLALEAKVHARTAELEAVSEALRCKSAELEAASLTDPLTGLHNRRYLAQHVEHDTARAVRRHLGHQLHGEALGDDADLIFFLVDIDHFKRVNDDHGHAAGDAVLVQVGERLRQVFRDADYLVRWGGEEFLVVAPGTSRAHAASLARRARAAIGARPFVLDDGQLLHKTCSIGYACFPLDPHQPQALAWAEVVKLADEALYRAKADGRDGWFGLESAGAATPAALQARAGAPLADWLASGELTVASSAVQPTEAGG
ncbi:MAG: hypothetical protein RLZZ584_3158 [Pseudomonadota bacterium]